MYRQQSEPRMGDQGTHLIHFIPFLTLTSSLNHRLALHESNRGHRYLDVHSKTETVSALEIGS